MQGKTPSSPARAKPGVSAQRPGQGQAGAQKTVKADGKSSAEQQGAKPNALPETATDAAVATVLVRDAYARERHYMLMRVIYAMAAVIVIQTTANVYMMSVARNVEREYFATDPNGVMKQLTPLSSPLNTTNEMLTWAASSITKAFTFSFANRTQEFNEARLAFTEGGWANFGEALKRSGILNEVELQRYVTTAVPTAAPALLDQGLLSTGRYAWQIQIPIVVTFRNKDTSKSQNLVVTAVIVRQSEAEHPRGLGIAQIIAE